MSLPSDYDAGWEFASTRSQVETDRVIIAMDCGEQAMELYQADDGEVDTERIAEFGQGAMDFLHDRPHRNNPAER